MYDTQKETATTSSPIIDGESSGDVMALFDVAQKITSCLELDILLKVLAETFLKYADGDRCVVLLEDASSDGQLSRQIKAIATTAGETTLCAMPLEATENLPIDFINRTCQGQQTQFLSNGSESDVAQYQLSSAICIPLRRKDGSIKSWVYVERQTGKDAFGHKKIKTLELLAAQGAIALENAQRYEQAKNTNHLLEQQLLDVKQQNVPSLNQLSPNKIQERLTFLIQQNPIGIIEWNNDFKVIGWNPAAEQIFGYAAAEMLGHHAEQIVPVTDRALVAEVMSDLIEQQGGYYSLNQNIRKDGVIITCEWLNTPLRDNDNKAIGIFSMVRDMSDRQRSQAAIVKKTEELEQALQELQKTQLQLVQGEKMSALGNLVAGVAHEINNPTGFVKGNISHAQNYVQDLFELIDFLLDRCPSGNAEIEKELEALELDFIREDLPKLLDSMNIGIDRIKNISKSLRTFSRKDRDEKTAFNIHNGIDSTLLILKHRTRSNGERPEIQITKTYTDLPKLYCFPGQLNQVFMNLLANSIDAFDEINQGKTFQEIEANPNRIFITTDLLPDYIIITIQDNAGGMSPETQRRIFEQGFTTKEVGKGTGLGMAIAHQIITEKHQGNITCDSVLGEGTTFTLELPIDAKN